MLRGYRSFITLLTTVMLSVVIVVLPVGAQDAAQSNKATLRLLYEVFNQRDIAVVNAFYADDYMSHTPSGDTPEAESFRDSLSWLHAAMPDFQIQVKALAEENDLVFSHLLLMGTFENDLVIHEDGTSFAATGQAVNFPVHTIARFDGEGQIVEEWVVFDNLEFLSQLDVLPLEQVVEATPEAVIDASISEIQIESVEIDDAALETLLGSFEDMLTRDNVQAGSDLVTADSVHWERGIRYDLEGWITLIGSFYKAIPDITLTPEMTITEGNLVAVYYILRGTSTGSFTLPDGNVLSANNSGIELPSLMLLRLNNQGQIVETWNQYDSLNLLAQMSVGPG